MSQNKQTERETNAPVFSFNFPIGTEFVTVPSMGLFYPEDSYLFGISEIEMKDMSGKDEEILTNKNYIKKGVVMDKLLSNLIVDKKIVQSLPDMLTGDKTALFVNARISGISEIYSTEVVCPKCDVKQTFAFDLNKHTHYNGLLEDTEYIQKVENNIFRITLPVSKVQVDMKLSVSRDSNKIIKLSQQNKENITNAELFEENVVQIFDPEGNSYKDKKSKEFFFANVPAKELLFLKQCWKEINPDFSLKQKFECGSPSCSYSDDVEPPITANFIYPR